MGSLVGLAADTHLNGVIFPIALFVVLLVRRTALRSLVFYSLGVVLAGTWWPGYISSRTPDCSESNSTCSACRCRCSRSSSGRADLPRIEDRRAVLVQPRASIVLAWVAVLAAIVLLRPAGIRSLLSLLALFGTVFLFMALFVGTRSPGYAVLLWPVGVLLVARLVDVSPKRVAVGLMGGLIVISIAASRVVHVAAVAVELRPSRRDSKARAANATVQADPFLWYGFSVRAVYRQSLLRSC